MNLYQKYINELIDEYDSLTINQITAMAENRFMLNTINFKKYIMQMCEFSDFKLENNILLYKDNEPDFDMIRSFEVLLKFIPNVVSHHKSHGDIKLRFFVNTGVYMKEIYIIPVKIGEERIKAAYAEDKFFESKSTIAIFLMDSKEQMKYFNVNCGHRFAIVTGAGAAFFKNNTKQEEKDYGI